MQVRFITLSAGPEGVNPPGSVADVSEDEARALASGHFAQLLEPKKADPAATNPPKADPAKTDVQEKPKEKAKEK